MKKYELIPSDRDGLFRIKALIDIICSRREKITPGTIGGYVSGEHNLSHEGRCWISDDATVMDSATVKDNARVSGNACICHDARLFGDCTVKDHAYISNSTIAHGAFIEKNAKVDDHSVIRGEVLISDNTAVTNAWIEHGVIIEGNAIVDGVTIGGNAKITDDAVIKSSEDIIVFSCWWNEIAPDSITWTRSNDRWSCGNFFGDAEHLLKFAETLNARSKQEVARIIRYINEIKSENHD